MNRYFTTGDISPVAYRVIINRLKDIGSRPIKVNPPLSRQEWLNIDDLEFEKKICMFMGWIHNPSSKPVDGWTDSNKKIPVEIKNHSQNIGVPLLKKFAGDMDELKVKEGIFVAWHFGKNCYEYVAKLKNKKIILKPAHEIIGELVLTKERMEEYQALYEERIKESKQKVRMLDDLKIKKINPSHQGIKNEIC